MKKRKVLFFCLLFTLLLAIIINGAQTYLSWQSLLPDGSYAMQVISVFFITPILIILPLIPLSLLGLIFKKTRNLSFIIFCSCLIYVFTSFFILNYNGHLRKQEFHRLADKSKPLVMAIHAYNDAKGRPPDKLDDLVPQYLPKIPGTGMGAYPEYVYDVAKSKNEWYGNPWVLYVETPLGVLNWDMFLYFPKQNYPKHGFGGYLEKIDDWAYVHE